MEMNDIQPFPWDLGERPGTEADAGFHQPGTKVAHVPGFHQCPSLGVISPGLQAGSAWDQEDTVSLIILADYGLQGAEVSG